MARGKLTDRMVRQVREPGVYLDGDGLRLKVQPGLGKSGEPRKSWVLRYTVDGRQREVGLGAAERVGLAEARAKAAELRHQARGGADPLEEKATAKAKLAIERAEKLSFRQATLTYLDQHESGWKNPKHRQQWRNTVEAYVFPVFGDVPVSDVTQAMVMAVLDPIWRTKTETASRVRGRIETILDWATVRGYRQGENPARWKGHLERALPPRQRVQKVQHHAAIPFDDLPRFWPDLLAMEGTGARCLAFLILTASRSGEARGARWEEIDLGAEVWTVPAERMKAARPHRVALSEAALSILSAQAVDHGTDGLVFPSDMRPGAMLSDMTLGAVLKRMGRSETVHGFRSAFRDWAGERTAYPRELAEAALAHVVGDATERAYARGDLLARRAKLMTDWAAFVTTPPAEGSNVIPFVVQS